MAWRELRIWVDFEVGKLINPRFVLAKISLNC
jgi:hypothetical protein